MVDNTNINFANSAPMKKGKNAQQANKRGAMKISTTFNKNKASGSSKSEEVQTKLSPGGLAPKQEGEISLFIGNVRIVLVKPMLLSSDYELTVCAYITVTMECNPARIGRKVLCV